MTRRQRLRVKIRHSPDRQVRRMRSRAYRQLAGDLRRLGAEWRAAGRES
ncbi:MAG: hypothetical protein ACLP52_25920 [Streptosporangiaceae bacterium]|jgi:hypothetical protein